MTKNTTNATPDKTYTLDQFIDMKSVDTITYHNFSILQLIDGVEHLDHNIIEDYLPELKAVSINVPLDDEQYKKYKYAPDLLAYDLYGSVQLDFIILLLNDCFDPKEFDKKNLLLPYASALSTFLNTVYSKEYNYLSYNKNKIAEENK